MPSTICCSSLCRRRLAAGDRDHRAPHSSRQAMRPRRDARFQISSGSRLAQAGAREMQRNNGSSISTAGSACDRECCFHRHTAERRLAEGYRQCSPSSNLLLRRRTLWRSSPSPVPRQSDRTFSATPFIISSSMPCIAQLLDHVLHFRRARTRRGNAIAPLPRHSGFSWAAFSIRLAGDARLLAISFAGSIRRVRAPRQDQSTSSQFPELSDEFCVSVADVLRVRSTIFRERARSASMTSFVSSTLIGCLRHNELVGFYDLAISDVLPGVEIRCTPPWHLAHLAFDFGCPAWPIRTTSRPLSP